MFQCGAANDEVELLTSEILPQLFGRRYQRLNPEIVDSKTCVRTSHGLRETPSLGLRASGLQQLPIHSGFPCNGALRLETIRADNAPRPVLDKLERNTIRIAAAEFEDAEPVQVIWPQACHGEVVGEITSMLSTKPCVEWCSTSLEPSGGRVTVSLTLRRQRSHIGKRPRLQPLDQMRSELATGHAEGLL